MGAADRGIVTNPYAYATVVVSDRMGQLAVDWLMLTIQCTPLQRSPTAPHRRQAAPARSLPRHATTEIHKIERHDRLGGLVHEYQHCRKATAGDHAALAADGDREVGWSEGADQSHDTALGTHRRGRSGRGRTLKTRRVNR
jgi:hypothetical protein